MQIKSVPIYFIYKYNTYTMNNTSNR